MYNKFRALFVFLWCGFLAPGYSENVHAAGSSSSELQEVIARLCTAFVVEPGIVFEEFWPAYAAAFRKGEVVAYRFEKNKQLIRSFRWSYLYVVITQSCDENALRSIELTGFKPQDERYMSDLKTFFDILDAEKECQDTNARAKKQARKAQRRCIACLIS